MEMIHTKRQVWAVFTTALRRKGIIKISNGAELKELLYLDYVAFVAMSLREVSLEDFIDDFLMVIFPEPIGVTDSALEASFIV